MQGEWNSFKVYKTMYLEQNLFERGDILPPCEYFKPNFRVIATPHLLRQEEVHGWFKINLKVEKNYGHVYDNITGFAQIKFSSQVTKSIVAVKIFSLY